MVELDRRAAAGLIVLAGGALSRQLGAAFFIACRRAIDLHLLLDHFSLLGLTEQSVTPGRVLGAAFVVAGVVCMKFL